jgi:hypothetical protein
MAGGVALAVCLGATPRGPAGIAPAVTVDPPVTTLHGSATVTVSGIVSLSVDVRLLGATSATRKPLGWRHLSLRGDTWSGTLPRPAVRGVYPIEIRTGPFAPILRSPRWMLSVLARGTLQRPSFATPEAVADWWAGAAPKRPSHLVAIRPWPLPDGDHRNPTLYRLFVIAYSRLGDPRIRDRLGIWITAFRDTPGGRWRLLEATVAPPA